MKFSVFQLSRKGGRVKNEDRMGYAFTNEAGLFLLADGMGGHPRGEVAAQISLQTIFAMFQKEALPKVPDAAVFLEAAIMAAHRQILRFSLDNGLSDTPRTTLVAALLQAGTVFWAHCGDSRLYIVRHGELLARTRDHSFLERLQSEGMDEAAAQPVNRNMLFTCLGSPSKPVFEIAEPLVLQQGDKLLLCSDGLWSSLSDSEIAYNLSLNPVSVAVPVLVKKALSTAGKNSDNVTAIAMEWETPDALVPTPASIYTDPAYADARASTVPADLEMLVPDNQADAAIEQSIAEIHAAIRRTSAQKK